MSDSNGHEKILGLLRESRGSMGTELLDVPSGEGPVLTGARELGYNVVEVDLFPRERMRGVVADACAPLPFADASFDGVLSMEGIEHFENQTSFVRECARVLRPGGRLILTTPNVLHLNARFSAFFTGQRLLKHGFINEVSTLRARDGKRLYHGHAYLIDIFRLRYILRIVGLELESLQGTSVSSSSVLLAPLVPFLFGLTHLSTWSARRRLERAERARPGPEIERELRRIALSPALLFRKKLIVVAHKPEQTGSPAKPAEPTETSGSGA